MFISSDCQKKFFEEIIHNNTVVNIYLRTGIKLTGRIIAVTDQVIFFNGPGPQIIYKNRVNTIIPISALTADRSPSIVSHQ